MPICLVCHRDGRDTELTLVLVSSGTFLAAGTGEPRTAVVTTRTCNSGTINGYENSGPIETQSRWNGTRQLCIIRQKQETQSRQTGQCGWNGTGQLITMQTQGSQERQTGHCGWNGTGQTLKI